MKIENMKYYLEKFGNILIAVAYIFGGLAILFPNASPMIQPFGVVSLGIILLTTGIFGGPYSKFFKKEE